VISSITPYARARLQALGYVEWIDGFNADNIPATQLESTFVVDLGTTNSVRMNQTDLWCETDFTVKIFKPTIRDNNQNIDDAAVACDAVIDEMMKVTNRLNQTVTGVNLKDIRFVSCKIEPLNETDDNGVMCSLEFKAITTRCTA
jgi:hypothetical protein